MRKIPCADCEFVIPIGEGDGICDHPQRSEKVKVVKLFEINPGCPVKEEE